MSFSQQKVNSFLSMPYSGCHKTRSMSLYLVRRAEVDDQGHKDHQDTSQQQRQSIPAQIHK